MALSLSNKLSEDVTVRFLIISGEIMMLQKRNKGAYSTLTAYTASLGITTSHYNNYESGSVVSVEVLARLTEVHGVNGHWLLTGKGAKYYMADMAGRISKLEERVYELESFLKLNEKPKR